MRPGSVLQRCIVEKSFAEQPSPTSLVAAVFVTKTSEPISRIAYSCLTLASQLAVSRSVNGITTNDRANLGSKGRTRGQ